MEAKPCSRCSRPADFSLALLLSTFRVRPRVQKCSQTIAFCNSCVNDVLSSLATSPLVGLRQRLINAYTAIAPHSVGALNPDQPISTRAGVHQGGRAVVVRESDKSISAFEEIL